MSNTERSKNLIAEAIRHLSDDFALSDARAMLSRALNEIQHVESKRSKRENIKPVASTSFAESRVATHTPTSRESTQWTREQIMTTISIIDKQIAEEKQKLEDMKKPKAAPLPSSRASDDLNGLING